MYANTLAYSVVKGYSLALQTLVKTQQCHRRMSTVTHTIILKLKKFKKRSSLELKCRFVAFFYSQSNAIKLFCCNESGKHFHPVVL